MFTVPLLLLLTVISQEQQRVDASRDGCSFTNVSISVLVDPPYVNSNISTGIISEFILNGLTTCFKTKVCNLRKTLQWRRLHSEEEIVTVLQKKQAQLVFPVPLRLITGSKRLTKTVEYYSVVTSPGLALIVNYHSCKKIANHALSQTVASVWPILVFSLLLAGISGVFIWATEHRCNNQQFSKSFTRGSYDGFWWAVVSMTTVGYGNQVPQSLLGRLFSLLWILSGVTIISVFTASISSAITVVSVQQYCSGLQGQTIAVLNSTNEEDFARHHGAIVKGYHDVEEMFTDLKQLKMKGILMERLKANYYLSTRKDEGFRIAEVYADKMEYTVAMVTDNDSLSLSECFKDVLENPWPKVNTIMKNYIHPVKPLTSSNETIGLFASNSDTVHSALIVLAVVLLVLIVCGVSWEIIYQKHNCYRPKPIPNNVLTNVQEMPMENIRHHHQDTPILVAQLQTAITDLTKQIHELKQQLQNKNIDSKVSETIST